MLLTMRPSSRTPFRDSHLGSKTCIRKIYFSRHLIEGLAKDSHALCLKVVVMPCRFTRSAKPIVTSTAPKASVRICLGSPQTLNGAKSTPLAWGTLRLYSGFRNFLRTRKREHRRDALTNVIRVVQMSFRYT